MKTEECRHEICITCGQLWNVSIIAAVPWFGYVCPRCRAPGKKTTELERNHSNSRQNNGIVKEV